MSFFTRVFSLFIFLFLLMMGAGLEIFILSIGEWKEHAAKSDLVSTDAIVVLTGGSERLNTGLDLLNSGHAKKLFISGVHAGISLDSLLGTTLVAPDLRACCIILGHAAGSTIGNANETAIWMRAENFHSLRLVTANYHMARSILLLQSAMPDIEIIPNPVTPENVKLEEWYTRPGTARLLIIEYLKYISAILHVRLTHE